MARRRQLPTTPATKLKTVPLVRWVPPNFLVKPIAAYAGMLGRLDGDAEAAYAISRAITELVEIGIAAVPQDKFTMLRGKRAAEQVRAVTWATCRELMLDMVRHTDVVIADLTRRLAEQSVDDLLIGLPYLQRTPEGADAVRPVDEAAADRVMAELDAPGQDMLDTFNREDP